MADLQVPGAIPEEDEKPVDFMRHIGVIRGRFWIILLCVLIFVSFYAIRAFRQPPIYQATAKLHVQRVPRQGSLAMTDTRFMVASQYDYRTAIKAITSREVMERALEEEDIAKLFPDRGKGSKLARKDRSVVRWLSDHVTGLFKYEPTRAAEPWERLRSRVAVSPDADSNIVLIQVAGANANTCMLIANAVAEASIEFSRSLRERGDVEIFRELQRQLEQQRERVTAARQAINDYREEHGLVKVGLATREDAQEMEDFKRLETQRNEAAGQLREVNIRLRAINETEGDADDEAWLRRTISQLPGNEVVGELRREQGEIGRQINVALKSFGPKHTEVLKLRAELDAVTQSLKEAVKLGVRLLQDRASTLQARLKEIESELKAERERLENLGRISSRYAELQADYELERRTYETLREQLKGVDLRRGFDADSIRMFEKASLPASPIGPDRQRALVVGAFIGLIIGLGIAYFLEYLDDTVKTPDDLENRLKLVPLGFVPDIETVNEGREGFIERAQHSLMFPLSSITEAFRAVRTNIYFSGEREHMKSLLVTSAAPGDGKTSFSANLAITFAQDGKRVLIVDADLRRPMLHHAFGVDREPGLSNLLVEGLAVEDVAQPMPETDDNALPTLRVMTAGAKTPNPAELMGGVHMRQFMANAREKFDLVIFDSCPILLVSDAAMVSEGCDGVVVIAKAGRSRCDALLRAKKQLEAVNARIIGAVLNGVGPKALRGQRYGYYYGYGYGYGTAYHDHYGADADPDETAAPRAGADTRA